MTSGRSALALALAACGGPAAPAVVLAPIVIPPPGPADLAAVPTQVTRPACPAGALVEEGRCARVLELPEIPVWQPPRGHGDPCATWSSTSALVDCDWRNEDLPDDAAAPPEPAAQRSDRADASRAATAPTKRASAAGD